jgi:hypothetical protein
LTVPYDWSLREPGNFLSLRNYAPPAISSDTQEYAGIHY